MGEEFATRMRRIGNKSNFMRESQLAEMEENNELVILNRKTDGGITTIELSLEPNKFDALGSECRLDFEEFCDVINSLVEEEEKEWDELRMKDQVNITRDKILEATILKYAKEKYNLKREEFNGMDLSYVKRYDEIGRFLGEAVSLTLTLIPSMNIKLR